MRLFLCEKPSQGKDIGRILGATQRGEGCLNGSGVTVTWCIGHLVEAAAPEVYDAALKRWSLEQLPIIPQQWRVEVKPKTATQFKVVKALLAKATQLVIATDADREEVLIREAHARERGIRAVPTFIIGGAQVVPGAQPAELWKQVIDELAAADR